MAKRHFGGVLIGSQGPIRQKRPSVLWALVPLLTLGWGAPFSFSYLAIRRRSRVFAARAAGYAVVLATTLYLLTAAAGSQNWQAALGTTLMLIVTGVGTVDAFWVRQQLDPSPVIRLSGQESAIAWATARMRLRDEARQLLEVSPRLADELHVGRPDLPHRFDDGGLVDANRASAAALTTAPGIDAALAERIVATRGSIRGFESLEDLSIALDIPPQTLDSARDFLVFRQ